MRRIVPSTMLALAAATLLSGCASAYDQQWKAPIVFASASNAAPLAGKWEGSWQSDDSDYYWGLAHAIITPLNQVTTKQGVTGQRYDLYIHREHFWLFPEDFHVDVTAVPTTDGQWSFYGERIINPLAGVERYDGFIDGDKIVTTYNSSKDYGTIVLRRLTPESPSPTTPAWGPNTNTH